MVFSLRRLFPIVALGSIMLSGLANAQSPEPLSLGAQLKQVHKGDAGFPAAVPDGYVITPVGFFHPDCVHLVREDEVLNRQDGTIHGPRLQRKMPACAHARFTPSGQRVDTPLSAAFDVPPATQQGRPDDTAPYVTITDDTLHVGTFDRYDGWVESIWAHPAVTDSMSFMQVDFSVPLAPVNTTTSTNFFFPGGQALDQTPDNITIIQPVLGWNGYSNLNAWTIASWDCCIDGNANASDYKVVPVGHTIRGVMQGTGCNAATGICANWSIVTQDLTSGESVTLNTVAHNQAFNWIFAGVLEVYGVANCNDLSASRRMDFTGISVKNLANQEAPLSYLTGWPNASVACNYGVYELAPRTAYRLQF